MDDTPAIAALLGPTNTGKTFWAMDRMLAHRTGMIGFPLRLLARENYDRAVAIKGAGQVALITGEEKIIPPGAAFFICTVEAMPMERQVGFLAVDEIQLAADPERGHVFTDRLLNARGRQETLFLGAATIQSLLRRLVPGIAISERPRLSTLAHAGHVKLSRLPPRSAVVAFSANEVYHHAELVRRRRGGTAVVLGALSPRARNAQIAMYQSGEVDFLVATDAIGMGLNMDIDQVAFAGLAKFDGRAPRDLTAAELAQIAGRAGRAMNDGRFGTTARASPLDPLLVEAVENHAFPPLRQLVWRNADLDFSTAAALRRGLDLPPPHLALARGREADDRLALGQLMGMEDVAALLTGPDRVRLLWEVCQIPDYRQDLTGAHGRLLARIFTLLTRGPLPEDFMAGEIRKLDRADGEFDALMARIAHVRTFTFIAHRPGWLADAAHWQEATRLLEDRLSDALHERLTERFVVTRQAVLTKALDSGGQLLAGVRRTGEVIVEGHEIGHLEGFRFVPDAAAGGAERRAVMAAARRALEPELKERVKRVEQAELGEIRLDPDGSLIWREGRVARLGKGATALKPVAELVLADQLTEEQADRVRTALNAWLNSWIAEVLAPLLALEKAELNGPARGIAFQVMENLGAVPRRQVADLIKDLTPEDRRALRSAGIRLGPEHVFLHALSKHHPVVLRGLLWATFHGITPPEAPHDGRTSVKADPAIPEGWYEAIGYPRRGPLAVRVNILDRLQGKLYDRMVDGQTPHDLEYAQLLGASLEEMDQVIAALGWVREERDTPLPAKPPAEKPGAKPAKAEEPKPEEPKAEEPAADATAEPTAEAAAEPAAETAAEAPAEAAGPFHVYRRKRPERRPRREGDGPRHPRRPRPEGQAGEKGPRKDGRREDGPRGPRKEGERKGGPRKEGDRKGPRRGPPGKHEGDRPPRRHQDRMVFDSPFAILAQLKKKPEGE